MTDDLVKRLRETSDDWPACLVALEQEAADRIEKLETALQRANANIEKYERKFYLGTDRIEKLEAALREIAAHPEPYFYADEMAIIARKALEGKDD